MEDAGEVALSKPRPACIYMASELPLPRRAGVGGFVVVAAK